MPLDKNLNPRILSRFNKSGSNTPQIHCLRVKDDFYSIVLHFHNLGARIVSINPRLDNTFPLWKRPDEKFYLAAKRYYLKRKNIPDCALQINICKRANDIFPNTFYDHFHGGR